MNDNSQNAGQQLGQAQKQIAIAIVLHRGRVLVGQRAADAELPGMAEFPGGKVEPGELPQAAAIRECREETGLPVRAMRLITETCFDYPHGRLRLAFFLCEPETAGKETPDNASPAGSFRWVPLDELGDLPFPSANAEALRLLRESPEIAPES